MTLETMFEPSVDVQTRVERAQSEPMEITIVSNEPLVVEVYNEESDRVHTVVPSAVHCSCEDSTYRNVVLCKHQIAVLTEGEEPGDGVLSATMAEDVRQYRATMHNAVLELHDQIEEIQSEIERLDDRKHQIDAVLNELDISHAKESTGRELLETLDSLYPDPDADSEQDSETETVETDDGGDEEADSGQMIDSFVENVVGGSDE